MEQRGVRAFVFIAVKQHTPRTMPRPDSVSHTARPHCELGYLMGDIVVCKPRPLRAGEADGKIDADSRAEALAAFDRAFHVDVLEFAARQGPSSQN